MNELFSSTWPAAWGPSATPLTVTDVVIVATTTSAAPGPEATRRLMWMLFLALALLLGILVLGVAFMTILRARRGDGRPGGVAAVRGATGQAKQAGGRGPVDPWAESGRRLGVGVARRPGRPAKSDDSDDFDLGAGDDDQSEGPAPPN